MTEVKTILEKFLAEVMVAVVIDEDADVVVVVVVDVDEADVAVVGSLLRPASLLLESSS